MRITKQDLRVLNEYSSINILDWIKNGLRHREDGPAEIWSSGFKFYYLEGRYRSYDKESYWKKIYENY